MGARQEEAKKNLPTWVGTLLIISVGSVIASRIGKCLCGVEIGKIVTCEIQLRVLASHHVNTKAKLEVKLNIQLLAK